jgi:hypothetical protein
LNFLLSQPFLLPPPGFSREVFGLSLVSLCSLPTEVCRVAAAQPLQALPDSWGNCRGGGFNLCTQTSPTVRLLGKKGESKGQEQDILMGIAAVTPFATWNAPAEVTPQLQSNRSLSTTYWLRLTFPTSPRKMSPAGNMGHAIGRICLLKKQ